MRGVVLPLVVIAAASALAVACENEEPPEAVRAPTPTAASVAEPSPLTAADVQMFLAVRSKALQRLEDALADVEANGGDVLAHVQELTVAERDAARALGVDWRRFTQVRDQIGHLLTSQRQHEDQRLLGVELARAREDLRMQLDSAREPASRQFLEAQLKVISEQLDKLNRERQIPAPQAEEQRVLESARAEIATLQGRQDRVQHRLQELLQRAATSGPTPAPPTRTAR